MTLMNIFMSQNKACHRYLHNKILSSSKEINCISHFHVDAHITWQLCLKMHITNTRSNFNIFSVDLLELACDMFMNNDYLSRHIILPGFLLGKPRSTTLREEFLVPLEDWAYLCMESCWSGCRVLPPAVFLQIM